MKNEMKIKFLAKNENVVFARTVSVAFLVNLEIELGILNEVKTAISEAVTNAIVHGYRNNESKWVELTMAYDDHQIIIEVIDEGIGIADIQKAREPLFSTKDDQERAGLGFTIMEVFMNEIAVYSKLGEGTRVKMIKNYYEG